MSTTLAPIKDSRRSIRSGRFLFAWAFALLILIPITDTRRPSPQEAYEHAHQLFVRGDLIGSEMEARRGFDRFQRSDPISARKFQVLQARILIWQGKSKNALELMAHAPSTNDNDATIERLTLEGTANTYLSQYSVAGQKFEEALRLCDPPVFASCGEALVARGVLALDQERAGDARQLFLSVLSLSRMHRDQRTEVLALLNLGWTAIQTEHFDEAVDWLQSGYRIAVASGWEARVENLLGNLGWAYWGLGDKERALQMFLDAQQRAEKIGDYRMEIIWTSGAGYAYRDQDDYARAADVHRKSLDLATRINSPQDVINSLEDLAYTDIMAGRLDDAGASLDKLTEMVRGNRLDELYVMLAEGEIAAARRDDDQAEKLFHIVEGDKASQISMRMGAEHQLARLYEAQGRAGAAEKTYRIALATFEAARSEINNETSKLPFLANATPIYDDYIHFLVTLGRAEEALAAADQSRARTLAQGLGLNTGKPSMKPAALRAADAARKTGSTVLFYWLGKQQSYLWAISEKKTSLFALPPQREIAPVIERHHRALLEPALGRGTNNPDGAALYRMLVEPAAAFIAPGGKVVVVCDGPLSLLNFESLIAPGTSTAAGPHFWIEDANVISAPSLYMLAAARPPAASGEKLLLMGDAISPNPDYPELPMARAEMQQIGKHFAPAAETVYARAEANSSAYLKSSLRDYAYIHFVAHGVASRTEPLESAIVLSRSGTAEDSFKLHAREIIEHPIDARLVTISACYGGGTRSYAGEGLVGLSWAFLRAGAHNVIGALWEASDDSTPQLMDKLYAGLADGMSPGAALRQAKLSLLHSEGKFREPFYWAPFQIYTGL